MTHKEPFKNLPALGSANNFGCSEHNTRDDETKFGTQRYALMFSANGLQRKMFRIVDKYLLEKSKVFFCRNTRKSNATQKTSSEDSLR